MNDLVSIITPSYNSSKFIVQAIESVLNQTYKNWEMIIVDDVSMDNSNEIIEEYMRKDHRIKLIKLATNSGPAVARNKAIKDSKGRYIAFLDADDLWISEKLEIQISFMQRNNLLFTYSSYKIIDENSTEIGEFITKKSINYHSLLKTCSIGCLTAIYDTKKIKKYYMEDVGHEDYTLWLKLLKEFGTMEGTLEPLAKYRVVNNSISSNKMKSAIWQWNIYRKIEKLSIIKSVYYFIHYAFNGFIKYK